MVLAVGVGNFTGAIFHLMTHAFFKACLFLGSGSVIHAMHHEQDIRQMGGLRKKLPITNITFFVSCLAIAGIPFFSGFFSKDEILFNATSQYAYSETTPRAATPSSTSSPPSLPPAPPSLHVPPLLSDLRGQLPRRPPRLRSRRRGG
jgi:NADH:ubiquinone oxidoreductase subunit 5 (subunit L)/multisubunit Na+/H+ antiporter MnhA subunit